MLQVDSGNNIVLGVGLGGGWVGAGLNGHSKQPTQCKKLNFENSSIDKNLIEG